MRKGPASKTAATAADVEPAPASEENRSGPRLNPPVIIHADEELLVVDKPAGVLSVHGRGKHPILSDVMKTLGLVPADEPFRIVHRIDLEASGVIVFARTLNAQQKLTAQFEARTVEKSYLALVTGYVATDGEVDLPIEVDEGASKARIDKRHGKPSKTRYRIIERVAGNTLLECSPETGRLHQIRVHMAAIGHPLAVDSIYSSSTALMLSTFKPGYRVSSRHEERPLIGRLTLHAARIAFDHPGTSLRVAYEAPLPRDFRATLNQLGRLSGPRR